MPPLRQALLTGLQSEDAHAHPHRREAFHLPLPRLQQEVQPEIKPACPLADAPYGRGTAEFDVVPYDEPDADASGTVLELPHESNDAAVS